MKRINGAGFDIILTFKKDDTGSASCCAHAREKSKSVHKARPKHFFCNLIFIGLLSVLAVPYYYPVANMSMLHSIMNICMVAPYLWQLSELLSINFMRGKLGEDIKVANINKLSKVARNLNRIFDYHGVADQFSEGYRPIRLSYLVPL